MSIDISLAAPPATEPRPGPPAGAPPGLPAPAPDARPPRFAALSYRDYRLYWVGSLISILGTQMSQVAIGWQVYQLTHDPLMLGLTGLFTVVPLIVLSLYGGVVADALDRRRLLLVTQVIYLAASALLAVTTLAGGISVWLIFGVVAVQG
ncbi:MAG TPA: MFS transporter, partial [Chloroflexia bacterium]|nr:MFS transporter [Chloroflexia bacterium]